MIIVRFFDKVSDKIAGMKPTESHRDSQKTSVFNRIIGITLIVAAATGMFISLYALTGMWRIKKPVEATILKNLETAATTLEATDDGLSIANQFLDSTSASIMAFETTVETLAKSIDDTGPFLDSLSTLMADDLPNAITSAQTSLLAAQSSARIIDSVLRSVTSIPFFPGDPYNPPVPLHVALAQVSDSLEGLPDSLSAMEGSLDTTNDNLGTIKVEVERMAKDISQIKDSLTEAKKVVTQYQTVGSDLQSSVKLMRARLPRWINSLAGTFSIVLLWLAITQVGLLVQGLELLGYYRRRRA